MRPTTVKRREFLALHSFTTNAFLGEYTIFSAGSMSFTHEKNRSSETVVKWSIWKQKVNFQNIQNGQHKSAIKETFRKYWNVWRGTSLPADKTLIIISKHCFKTFEEFLINLSVPAKGQWKQEDYPIVKCMHGMVSMLEGEVLNYSSHYSNRQLDDEENIRTTHQEWANHMSVWFGRHIPPKTSKNWGS